MIRGLTRLAARLSGSLGNRVLRRMRIRLGGFLVLVVLVVLASPARATTTLPCDSGNDSEAGAIDLGQIDIPQGFPPAIPRVSREGTLAVIGGIFAPGVPCYDTLDYYRFRIGSRSRVHVHLFERPTSTMTVALYGRDPGLPAFFTLLDPSVGDAEEDFEVTAPPGEYFIAVMDFGTHFGTVRTSATSYTVQITVTPIVPPDFAGNSFTQARQVPITATPTQMCDFVTAQDVHDFYAFHFAEPRRLTMSLAVRSIEGGVGFPIDGVDVTVWDAIGRRRIEMDRATALRGVLYQTELDPGFYYVSVAPMGGQGSLGFLPGDFVAEYCVSLSAQQIGYFEPGSTRATAATVGMEDLGPGAVPINTENGDYPPGARSGCGGRVSCSVVEEEVLRDFRHYVVRDWVGTSDRTDYHRFVVTSAGRLTLNVGNLFAAVNVTIEDAQGAAVGQAQPSGASLIDLLPPMRFEGTLAPGEYFVRVAHAGSSGPGTSYQLHLVWTPGATPVPPVTLSVTAIDGGTVTSAPAGIQCGGGGACSAQLAVDSDVTLTATPNAGSVFTGWGGACSGSGACTVRMDTGKTVTATFLTPTNRAPAVSAGLNQSIALPASVALQGSVGDDGLPNPPGAITLAWTKVSGPGTVTFGDPASAGTSASFSDPGTYVLRLTASDGVIARSADVTIGVQAAGQEPPPPNLAPVVAVTADRSIVLPASATVDGTVTDDGLPDPPRAVTTAWTQVSGPAAATFGSAAALRTTVAFSVPGTYVLRLTADDGGTTASRDVTITVLPTPPRNQAPSVNAGPDQVVTLPAPATLAGVVTDDGLPDPPRLTTTWTKGTGPGAVTFAAAAAASTTASFSQPGVYALRLTASDGEATTSRDVTVTVRPPPMTVVVQKSGAGAGTVVSDPAGVTCGSTCTATFTGSTGLPLITLDATPSTGSRFAGWSGAGCSGTAPCVVSADATVTAAFDALVTVSVAPSGAGAGTVMSQPAGIHCSPSGGTCSATFDTSAVVTLTATPAAGVRFAGWTGPCSGTGVCTVTNTASVTAAFEPLQPTASAGGHRRTPLDVKALCPTVMPPGATFTIPVTLRNRSSSPLTVTRGALTIHRGGAGVTGPAAFETSSALDGAGAADTAETTVTAVMPVRASARDIVFFAASFFGHLGDRASRRLLGTGTCHVETAAPGVVTLASIETTPGAATLPVGGTRSLVARGRFSNGATQDPLVGVRWISETIGVATVDPAGVVTALSLGKTRVRAIRDGVTSAAVLVTVAPDVIGLNLSPATALLDAGAGLQLAATGIRTDGTAHDATTTVEWRSDAPGIAFVDATGFVRAVAPGVARITARHPGGLVAAALMTVSRSGQIAVSVAPTPIAIPPDGLARTFAVRLSSPDTTPHTVALSVLDDTVASVSPAQVTFAPGQTVAQGSITGLRTGHTTLRAGSAALAGASVPLLVTHDFQGVNIASAPPLGVVRTPPPGPADTTPIGPIHATALGVVRGSGITRVSPRAFVAGTGPMPIVITGAGLGGVDAVTIVPAGGLTLGTLSVAPDGTSVIVPLTVAADATRGVRQVVVTAAGARIAAATADGDRIVVASPAPIIDSIGPLFGVPGTTSVAITIRGQHLHGVESVALSPDQDVTVGSAPVVSADGTQLTVTFAIAGHAATGPRVVTVTTPGGTSSATGSAANTFSIVPELRETVTPVVAPLLGVRKELTTPAPTRTDTVFAPAVGVARGATARALVPSTGTIGTTVTATVLGAGLDGVTAIGFVPSTGLAVHAVTVAPDGASLTADVTIAPDAPATPRTVQLFAGSTPVHFAPAGAAVFLVTAPPPQLDSVSPVVIQTGSAGVVLTLRGRNLEGASRVDVVPPADVSVAAPAASADGTIATVAISVGAAAAPGQRVVSIVTPGGATSTASGASNTITLVSAIGPTVTPIAAPIVGVLKHEVAPPSIPLAIGPIASPALGVRLEAALPPPPSVARTVAAPVLGVARGTAATSIAPAAIAPGTTSTLIIHGSGLTAVSGVSVRPPDGVTIGVPVKSADGRQVEVSVTVDAGQTLSTREVVLATATGPVAFGDPRAALLVIQPPPAIESVTALDVAGVARSPLVCQDTAHVRLAIRGDDLRGAVTVTATPADGLAFGSLLSVATEGPAEARTDVLTIELAVAADAPLVARVIRVHVPGFASTDQQGPQNTLTVNTRPRPDTNAVCPGVAASGG